MKTFKRLTFIFFLLIVFIVVSAISYVSAVSENISNSVFRLHVIANSDSEEDQNLKYIVRDKLLEYMNTITSGITSKDTAIEIAKAHEKDFYNIAKKTIEENGYTYDVKIEIGNSYFPTKYYGDISFPAGFYDSLKVEIGNASGQNWWCVMFPPLCYVDMSTGIVPDESKQTMKETLADEEYAIISDTTSKDICFKFKLIEFSANNQLR